MPEVVNVPMAMVTPVPAMFMDRSLLAVTTAAPKSMLFAAVLADVPN